MAKLLFQICLHLNTDDDAVCRQKDKKVISIYLRF